MPLANRSTTLNAVVAAAASDIPQGYAFCETSPFVGFVVATTANRAAVGGELAGVAVSVGIAGRAFSGVAVGRCEPEEVGIIGGSGDYVEVTSTGALTRSSTTGANTIGNYLASGAIHVDPALQFGGAVTGNATAIQGVAVSSASAARSYILAGDGTNIRSRRGQYNFLDWGPDETGATDCLALLQTAINEIPNYSDLYVPLPSTYFKLALDTNGGPLKIWDDLERGNKRGIRIVGEGPPAHNGGKYHFRATGTRKSGTAASITARTNGGSGDNHQTVTLGGSSGVNAADVARWRGRHLIIYNAATDANNCEAIIVDVPSNDTVRVSNQNTGAAGTDANNGALCWWIDEPVIDIRAKDCALENLGIGVVGGAELGALVEFTHAPGESANSVLQNNVLGCTIHTDSRTSGTIRDCMWIARDLVPTHSGNFCWRGLNGLGEYQVGHPSQTDTFRIERCSFGYATRSGIAFWSTTAQSKENRIVECQFGAGTILMQHAVCVPKDVKGAGGWSSVGNAHFDLYKCAFGLIRDACVQIGGYGSKEFIIEGCYSENASMMLRAGTNTSHVPITIRSCTWSHTPTWRHRSGQILKTNGCGPLVIEGGFYDSGGDAHDNHLEINVAPTTRAADVTLRNFWFKGTTSYSRRTAFRVSTLRGPFNFSNTPYLRLTVDGGAAQEVQITQASMNAACLYTVNLAEIHTWELAMWIDANFTGATAWGEGDDSFVYVRTETLTGAGTIQVGASVGSPDANTKVGWNTGLDTAGAQTQLQKDSAGIVDWTKSAGTTGWTHLRLESVSMSGYATDTSVLVNDVNKHYNLPAAMGRNALESVAGLSQTGGVPPKNLYSRVTHSGGAGATFTWTFTTAEEDTSYDVFAIPVSETGAPAAGARTVTAVTKNTGSAVFTATDPGGAATVTWHVELRR